VTDMRATTTRHGRGAIRRPRRADPRSGRPRIGPLGGPNRASSVPMSRGAHIWPANRASWVGYAWGDCSATDGALVPPVPHTTNRPLARPVSAGRLGVAPSRATASRVLGRLQQRAATAGADERLGRRTLDVDDERLEVGLHAAVGSNAVHPRRLGIEAAHRCLAADRAGAGHAWSSGGRDGGRGARKGPNGAVE
jgi:hypothetical protein